VAQLDFEQSHKGDTPNSAKDNSGGAPERLGTAGLRVGLRLKETYLVNAKDLRTAKNGKPYMRLKLADRDGQVVCMVWDDVESLASGFEGGDVVWIEGRVTEFDGQLQIEAAQIRRVEDHLIDPSDFLPRTYRDVDELKGFLAFHIESVYDSDLRRLLDAFFGDPEFLEMFVTAPAAKQNHHAYLGGLLEHTVSVAALSDHIAQQYARINRDLLITAGLLHDIGKVEELTYGTTIDFSSAGRFLGHTVLGLNMVAERARGLEGFPEDKLHLVLHCLASHHGELEWGSPKRPKTIEALILHHVDNLDAKVKGFLEIVEGSRTAPWTDLRNLFRRPLHVPQAAHQEEDFLPPQEDPR